MEKKLTTIVNNKFEMKTWIEKSMNFLVNHTFIYVLNTLIGVLGLGHLIYVLGYMFLYGFYFGKFEPSLLVTINRFIPFRIVECIIVGLFILAIISFLTMMLYLAIKKKLGWVKFALTILFFLLVINIIFIFAGYSTSLSDIGFYLIPYWVQFGKLIIYLIIPVLLIFAVRLVVASIIKHTGEAKYSFSQFLCYTLLIFGVTLACIVPLTNTMVLKVGTSVGNVLIDNGYAKNKHIFIGDNKYVGQVVAKDEEYIYLTTMDRELLIVHKDGKKHQEDLHHIENFIQRD